MISVPASASGYWLGSWDELGQFAQVLGSGGEVEFVAGATRAAQSQPVELQDALEVREQHLDLFR